MESNLVCALSHNRAKSEKNIIYAANTNDTGKLMPMSHFYWSRVSSQIHYSYVVIAHGKIQAQA